MVSFFTGRNVGGMGGVGKGLRIIPISQSKKDMERAKKKNHRILNIKIANTMPKYTMSLRIESLVEKDVAVLFY